jgi:hypothetical protein
MTQKYFAHYVDREELLEFLKTQKPKRRDYIPFLMVEPIESFDSESFRCYFLGKNEIGSLSMKEENWHRLTEWDITINTTFIDYFTKAKDCYMTFDGVSFYKITDIRILQNKELEIHLKRLFKPTYTEQNTAFMVMPFRGNKLNEFYKKNIAEYLGKKLKIKVARSDDFTDNDVIIDRIYREIEKAEFIICEITECNKNVFYEIGYAKGINKQLIFIAQRGTKDLKFFDVAHIRRIDYDIENPVELQEKLRDTIDALRNKVAYESK